MFNARVEQWELWVLQLDRPDARRMIGVGLFPQWSLRVDSTLYRRARERGGRGFKIWCLNLEKDEPAFLVELAASSQMALIRPIWSPDGEVAHFGLRWAADGRVYFTSLQIGSENIWPVKASGGLGRGNPCGRRG